MSKYEQLVNFKTNLDFPSRIVLVNRDLNGERSFGGFVRDNGKGFSDENLALHDLKRIFPELSKEAVWLVLGTIPLASTMTKKAVLWIIDQAKKKWNKDCYRCELASNILE